MSRVILGVAGGIAAYKACELLRRLQAEGHDVTVIPTAAALEFVGAATWAALSGKPVHTSVFDDVHQVPHVRLGQQADLVIVAPATADLLARAATGRADDLLTSTLLTAHCPVVFAPGDAHRDVAARGHPGQRRHAPVAGLHGRRPRLGPADRPRHRTRSPAGPRRARRRRHRRAHRSLDRAAGRGARPGGSAGRGECRRHPGAPRPRTVPRQPLLGSDGLGPGPGRRAARRRGRPGRRERDPAGPARDDGAPGRLDRRPGRGRWRSEPRRRIWW